MKDLKGNDKLDWMANGMIQLASEVENEKQFEELIKIRGEKYQLDHKAIGILQSKSKSRINEIGFRYKGTDITYEKAKLFITMNEKAEKLFSNIDYGSRVYNENCINGYKTKAKECLDKLEEGINKVKYWIRKYDPTIDNLNTNQYNISFEKYFLPNKRIINKNKPKA